MAVDPYAPCPCGSGDKLKFCCLAIAPEMERVGKLEEGRQTTAALKAMEKLILAHPKNPWVLMVQARLLGSHGRPQEAINVLDRLLVVRPDDGDAHLIRGMQLLVVKRRGQAYDAVDQALQRKLHMDVGSVVGILQMVISSLIEHRDFMAARKLTTPLLAIQNDQVRRQAASILEILFSDTTQLHPLRSVFLDRSQDPRKPRRQMAWRTYARKVQELARESPDDADLAFDAAVESQTLRDVAPAAPTLREAARKQTDFEAAVELETLAQCDEATRDIRELPLTVYQLASMAQTLSRLDADPRLLRIAAEEDENEIVYEIAHALPPGTAVTSFDEFPLVHAFVKVYPAVDESPACLGLFGTLFGDFAQATSILQEAAGEGLQPASAALRAEFDAEEMSSAELTPLAHSRTTTSVEVGEEAAKELHRRDVARKMDEVWPNLRLKALGGKTPLEAVGVPGLQVALAGALNHAEALTAGMGCFLDIAAWRTRLQLPAPTAYEVQKEELGGAPPVSRMLRADLDKLADDDLWGLAQAMGMLRHSGAAYRLMRAYAERGTNFPATKFIDVWNSTASLALQLGRYDEALSALGRSRERIGQAEQPAVAAAVIDLLELRVRVRNPADPEIANLIRRFQQQHLAKLPNLEQPVMTLLMMNRIELPRIQTLGGAGSAAGGGLWTPETAAAPAGGGGLWIPGQ